MAAAIGHRGAGLSPQQIWVSTDSGLVTIPAGGLGSLTPESILIPVAGFEWFRVNAASFSCNADPLVQFVDMLQLFLNFYDSGNNFIDFLVIAAIAPIPGAAGGLQPKAAVSLSQPLERINIQASLFPAGVAKFSINGHAVLSNPTAGDLSAAGGLRGLVEAL